MWHASHFLGAVVPPTGSSEAHSAKSLCCSGLHQQHLQWGTVPWLVPLWFPPAVPFRGAKCQSSHFAALAHTLQHQLTLCGTSSHFAAPAHTLRHQLTLCSTTSSAFSGAHCHGSCLGGAVLLAFRPLRHGALRCVLLSGTSASVPAEVITTYTPEWVNQVVGASADTSEPPAQPHGCRASTLALPPPFSAPPRAPEVRAAVARAPAEESQCVICLSARKECGLKVRQWPGVPPPVCFVRKRLPDPRAPSVGWRCDSVTCLSWPLCPCGCAIWRSPALVTAQASGWSSRSWVYGPHVPLHLRQGPSYICSLKRRGGLAALGCHGSGFWSYPQSMVARPLCALCGRPLNWLRPLRR